MAALWLLRYEFIDMFTYDSLSYYIHNLAVRIVAFKWRICLANQSQTCKMICYAGLGSPPCKLVKSCCLLRTKDDEKMHEFKFKPLYRSRTDLSSKIELKADRRLAALIVEILCALKSISYPS